MTANRWWVKMAARWLARIDGVSGQLQLAMLIMTGLSTATLTLKSYGYSQFAGPLIAVTGVAGLVFAYLYTEGGVWNQVNRDRQDLSTNFAQPSYRINDELLARGFLAAFKGRELSQEERSAIQDELDEAFADYRDGINLGEDGSIHG